MSEAGEAAKLPGGGLDAALARAEGALRDGRLAAAADGLEQAAAGTAAAPVAREWARGARGRAAADQAAALLQVQLPAFSPSVLLFRPHVLPGCPRCHNFHVFCSQRAYP